MKIGILALQGAFVEHEQMLKRLGVDCFEIRQKKDAMQDFDGLIIPGGESTVMHKLLIQLELFDLLQKKIQDGMPVWGTCAGLILLADQVEDGESTFATMQITAKRNAYGRQLGSFKVVHSCAGIGDIPMIFIRAPYIKKVGEATTVLATVDDRIVAARQGNQFVTAFHPELTDDVRVHIYFVNMVKDSLKIIA